MSRGPGIVQRRIIAAFEQQPTKLFTVKDLAALTYPGETTIERKHRQAVQRALRTLVPQLGLWKCRLALPGAPGWRHGYQLTSSQPTALVAQSRAAALIKSAGNL